MPLDAPAQHAIDNYFVDTGVVQRSTTNDSAQCVGRCMRYTLCLRYLKTNTMISTLQTVDREHKGREIDKNCKCKFSFTWLDKSVEIKRENGQQRTSLASLLKKTDEHGQAVCTLCNNAMLQYGGRGIAALTDHLTHF